MPEPPSGCGKSALIISKLNDYDHNSMVNSFAIYYRGLGRPEGYYGHINSNYSWNWTSLLDKLGFKKK